MLRFVCSSVLTRSIHYDGAKAKSLKESTFTITLIQDGHTHTKENER
jgi:hypothetical protein